MADHPRFGPSGIPPTFLMTKRDLSELPAFLQEEGLDAFEYEAAHWGAKPQIKKENAERLGLKAKEKDVWTSLHGSYFINFGGTRDTVEASKKRLVASATAADWMKAYVVVFHPGYYGERSRKEVFRNVVESLKDVVQTLRALNIKDVKLGPETSGKLSQIGSLDEILALCEQVEQTQLVIDWSHLHARDRGRFVTAEDFRRVVELVEGKLGSETAQNMHCHFTRVEFSYKGERRHRVLDEAGYGPDFAKLAKVIAEFHLKPVIISETPLLDLDAMKMRDIFRKEMQS